MLKSASIFFYFFLHLQIELPLLHPHAFLVNYLYLPPIFAYDFFVALQPNVDYGLLILEVSRSHTTTQHIG